MLNPVTQAIEPYIRQQSGQRSIFPDTLVQFLKGVGPHFGDVLRAAGIRTVEELLNWFPRAYEDRRAARTIASLQLGELVSIRAQVIKVSSINLGKSRRKIYDVLIGDSTGRIRCKYFRVPYKGYFERFQPQQTVRVVGRVINYRSSLEFHHPDIQDDKEENLADKDQIVPIYPETQGITNRNLKKIVKVALDGLLPQSEQLECLPQWLLKREALVSRYQALRGVHEPPQAALAPYLEFRSEFHRRLIFDEFFWLELYLAAKKLGIQEQGAPQIANSGTLLAKLRGLLPFQLTAAQESALSDVNKDLSQGRPMHRLIQGDVGSGKTLVALGAALKAIESGYQVALMAPTEILAEQHFANAAKWFSSLGVNVGILTGSSNTVERRQTLEMVKNRGISLLIGTHALIEDEVDFARLGLVIVDEQHRFGVAQRAKLKTKGQMPHFLIMTATPIPRSLAMTVYGDLDVTRMTEMPKGRAPIKTRVTYQSKWPMILQFAESILKKGQQAYVIYPLVEESEKIDLQDAVSAQKKWQEHLPGFQVGLLHGKMRSDEKDLVMDRFRKKEIHLLVSTTVIEVGVDVPNATLMIIENGERFGLSQLHQLRGRVGRGNLASFCVIVLGYAVSEEAKTRSRVLEETTDGFRIAEADLELRGPGEFLGTRQSGLPGFRMANLVRDVDILEQARRAAFDLLKADPKLMRAENAKLKKEFFGKYGPGSLTTVG